MRPIYATATDYTNWTGGTAPANIANLLRSASGLVRRDTVTAIYTADDDGLPTDTDLLAAFRDATCVQAAAWAALNIDPLAGGAVTSNVKLSKSIDGASVTYADAAQAGAARADAVDCLVPEAWRILEDELRHLSSVRTFG